jgi:hypothetical protein
MCPEKIILGHFLTGWAPKFPPVIDSVVITSLNHVYVYKIIPRCRKNSTQRCKG